LTILLYLSAVAMIGIWVGRRQRTTAEYFVANRRLPGWAVSFSIIGTVISSVSFVALPGAAFAENWRLIVPNLTVPLVLIVVTLIIVPFYRRVIGMSSYEYLERRFGLGARLYGSFGFLLLRTVDLGFTLLLTAIAVEVLTGWDIRYVVVGIGLFTLIYTLIGGIEAVVWNDVLQGLVLVTGMLLLLAIVLFRPEGGPLAVLSMGYQHGKFSLGDYSLSWESLFADRPTVWIFLLVGISHFGRSYMVEQNMVQRYLVARTDREAQQATLIGALLCVAIWITFSTIGSSLWSFYQITGETLPAEVLQKPDNIIPYFVATQFPRGLVGLLLAAILAAAMQAFSADLTSVATVATQDYFARFLPQSSDRARLFFGRCAVLAGGLMAVGVALQLTQERTRAVYEIFVILAAVLAGGMLGLFAAGFLSTRTTGRGAYVGISTCLLFVLWGTVTGPLKVDLGVNFEMHSVVIGILSHPLLFGVTYASSLVLGGKRTDLSGLTIWNLRGRLHDPGSSQPVGAAPSEVPEKTV
jgi:SSS family solute:Na+ symporter